MEDLYSTLINSASSKFKVLAITRCWLSDQLGAFIRTCFITGPARLVCAR
jgi:hypothetical protein